MILHGDEYNASLLADLIHRGNVRMADGACGARLAHEAQAALLVLDQARR